MCLIAFFLALVQLAITTICHQPSSDPTAWGHCLPQGRGGLESPVRTRVTWVPWYRAHRSWLGEQHRGCAALPWLVPALENDAPGDFLSCCGCKTHGASRELGGFSLGPFWASLDLLQDFNRTLLSRDVQERKRSPCC